MARPIEVTSDPELRHRLGAGADWNAGSRILAERISRRSHHDLMVLLKRRHRRHVALLWAVGLAVWALAAYGAYGLFVVLL